VIAFSIAIHCETFGLYTFINAEKTNAQHYVKSIKTILYIKR